MSAPRLDLTPPADWRDDWETNEGALVHLWRPPPPLPGVLRMLTDKISADGPDSALVAIKAREIALRFVRPDDNRASDRIIEDRPGGGLIASAVIAATNQDGAPETHYLWMIAVPADSAVLAAMAALAMPGDADGSDAAVSVVTLVDELLREARISAA